MPAKTAPPSPYMTASGFADLRETRGVALYYEVMGPGDKSLRGREDERTLLLLLGSVADLRRRMDRIYGDVLVKNWRILMFDHRNTGQSTIKDEPCSMEDYADDAAALLEHVLPGMAPVYVLGNSFGGSVAQHLALRHPHLVKKLVLAACSTGGAGGTAYPMHELYRPGISAEERVKKRMMLANSTRDETWIRNNADEWKSYMMLMLADEEVGKGERDRQVGIRKQLEARLGHDTWEAISSLEMPVLCLTSPQDGICLARHVRAMAEKIGGNAEVVADLTYGHACVAADLNVPSMVTEWLTKPLPEGSGPAERPAVYPPPRVAPRPVPEGLWEPVPAAAAAAPPAGGAKGPVAPGHYSLEPVDFEIKQNFLLRKATTDTDKITRVGREPGASLPTTGKLFVGQAGGKWIQQRLSSGEAGQWCLVFGPGFNLKEPLLAHPTLSFEALGAPQAAELTLKVMSPIEAGKPLCDLEIKDSFTVADTKRLLCQITGLKRTQMIMARGKMGERVPEDARLDEDKMVTAEGYRDGDEIAFIYMGDLEGDLSAFLA